MFPLFHFHHLSFTAPRVSLSPTATLSSSIRRRAQVYTQKSSKRPYGVGMLVVGHDKTGPHLFETCPSGNYTEYHAQAIGARSQSARTYLERHFEVRRGWRWNVLNNCPTQTFIVNRDHLSFRFSLRGKSKYSGRVSAVSDIFLTIFSRGVFFK
jgi:hypothetical protein